MWDRKRAGFKPAPTGVNLGKRVWRVALAGDGVDWGITLTSVLCQDGRGGRGGNVVGGRFTPIPTFPHQGGRERGKSARPFDRLRVSGGLEDGCGWWRDSSTPLRFARNDMWVEGKERDRWIPAFAGMGSGRNVGMMGGERGVFRG